MPTTAHLQNEWRPNIAEIRSVGRKDLATQPPFGGTVCTEGRHIAARA